MSNCPKCNTKSPTGASFCENCGNVLSIPKHKIVQPVDMNFCPDCGKDIEMDASFCAHCGTSFGEQCPQCQTINQADAKFCEKCAEPLNWICPICNNKNQAGAMFCASCGSDSVKKKRIYQNPKFIGVAASILILLGVFGMKYNQFDKDINNAYSYTNNNKFTVAMQYANDAKNNWLPFTNAKADRTIRYINNREENYKEQQASSASSNRSSGSSRRSSNSNSSSSKIEINGTNLFSITIENKGFINIEIPKYTVKILRTADLNGEHVYDYPREETHTSGFFGSNTNFYDATYGYYTVEYYGYDKFDRKVFSRRFVNVLHKCYTIATFYTNTDWSTPSIYCFD